MSENKESPIWGLVIVAAIASYFGLRSDIHTIDFEDECKLAQQVTSSTTRTRVALANGHCRGQGFAYIAIDDDEFELSSWQWEFIDTSKYEARGEIQGACRSYQTANQETRNPKQAYENGVCRAATNIYEDYAGCWVWESFTTVSTNLAAGRFSDPCE